MVFKICHDQAEMSPVQSFSTRILLPQIAFRLLLEQSHSTIIHTAMAIGGSINESDGTTARGALSLRFELNVPSPNL
jgi:hypothetical protein